MPGAVADFSCLFLENRQNVHKAWPEYGLAAVISAKWQVGRRPSRNADIWEKCWSVSENGIGRFE
jgi:hypothetical protein